MKINLNKLMNYKSLAYGASNMAQLGKVKEEYLELLNEVVNKDSFSYIKDRDNFVAESLDLITATINLLLIIGITEKDFDKHINKLEYYKNVKYK
nr:MAG TPA: Phosphoribosyl-ATP pyrophosphatase [Caudoviricetes sp.]